MSYKTNLEFAYHMGYEDALARKMPDADKVAVLLPDVADGAGEYVCGTDGHEGHWLTGEEIVRCRDCKFYTPESMTREERGFGVYEDVWEPGGCFNPERCSSVWDAVFEQMVPVGINTEPDGFCKWGRRKEDK